MRAMTMTIGKSFDTHGPLGPWLVTPDELGDPQKLGIRTFVNDEQRQDGNTAEMVFGCSEQVSHLSEAFTLEPGDVIATGTPAGVGSSVQPFPSGLPEARRHGAGRDRRDRRAAQLGDRGARRLPRRLTRISL